MGYSTPIATRNQDQQMTHAPAFHAMTLRELADWVAAHNNGLFDTGEFSAVDDLEDDEEAAARDEYESMADEIFYGAALGPCNK
jgi:hypothetical protein